MVRDQIALIIKCNIDYQKTLAAAASPYQDPAAYDLRVFIERANPFEEFLNDPDTSAPIVNIWYDSQSFDRRTGNVSRQQQGTAIFNIDVYAKGVSECTREGHAPGDKDAALEAQRAAKLVRNIIMADINTYLQLPRGKDAGGYFGGRWIDSIQSFQPEIDSRPAQHVQGMRIALSTSFVEFAPQQTNETLDIIHTTVKRKETGEVYFEVQEDFS